MHDYIFDLDLDPITNYTEFTTAVAESKLAYQESKLKTIEVKYFAAANTLAVYAVDLNNFVEVENPAQFQNLQSHKAYWEGEILAQQTANEWLLNASKRPEAATVELTAEESMAFANFCLQQKKILRIRLVNALTVEVDGVVLDGDELAQTRMARAITALPAATSTTLWLDTSNTMQTLTRLQLAKALELAGAAQTALWDIYS